MNGLHPGIRRADNSPMGVPSMARERMRGPGDDSGFTLVEAVVALFVLGIVFTAMAAAAMGSLRASMSSRAEQQAIDFATEALEQARQADYYSLGHDATDIAADTTNVTSCSSTWCFNPGDGPEQLIIAAGGSVNPHTTVVSSTVNNGVDFAVSTYVTKPAGSTADYKRVTVVTRWNVGSLQRERRSSSIVTATSRGLPIPLFTFKTAVNAQTVNLGSDAVFKIEMTNQGALDTWNLAPDTGTWTFWRDNGDNVLCRVVADCATGVVEDQPLVDGDDAGGVVDTGRLDPTTSMVIWAVRAAASNGVLGEYWTSITARAISTEHQGVPAGVGVQTLALYTKVTNVLNTQPPVVVAPTPVAPSPPRTLSLTVGDGQLTANWLVPDQPGTAAISDYKVEYKRSSDLSWITESTTSTALTATLGSLTNGTRYDVRVAAVSSAGTSAYTSTFATPTVATSYEAPSICAATFPSTLPTADPSGSKAYVLHNRSSINGSWPGAGAPLPSSTAEQGVPLNLTNDNKTEFGAGTTLPVYSSDISADQGRVIIGGGSFTSANTATTQFVDWRTSEPGKQYSGQALLTFWVAPASGASGTGFNLAAQLYRSTALDTTMDVTNTDDLVKTGSPKRSQPVSLTSATWCAGPADWQKVAIQLPIDMRNPLGPAEFLGVRLWNAAGGSYSTRVRIAYDVAYDVQGRGFPATLTLPEM